MFGDPCAARVRQYLLIFAVLGEGRARLACAKRSVARLLIENLDDFGTCSL